MGVGQTLLAKLRSFQPYAIKAIDAAEGERNIAVPDRRRKWASVLEALDARPWVRVELLDKKGATLAYHDNDDMPGDMESIGEGVPAKHAETAGMLRIMLDAQRTALSFRDKEFTTLMATVTDVIREQGNATKQLVALYQAQVAVTADVAYAKAQHDSGGDLQQWKEILEASPELLAKFAPLLQLLFAKRAPRQVTNGTKETPKS